MYSGDLKTGHVRFWNGSLAWTILYLGLVVGHFGLDFEWSGPFENRTFFHSKTGNKKHPVFGSPMYYWHQSCFILFSVISMLSTFPENLYLQVNQFPLKLRGLQAYVMFHHMAISLVHFVYSNHPKTGHPNTLIHLNTGLFSVRYSNALHHLKTGHFCPVFKWFGSTDV